MPFLAGFTNNRSVDDRSELPDVLGQNAVEEMYIGLTELRQVLEFSEIGPFGVEEL